MTEFPETRESLLLGIRDPRNREAWEQFAQIYRPVVYRLARQRGLQDADAQDLTQQVLISVASAIGRWEKNGESVRFRHWLKRVARNAILNALSRKPQDLAVGGSSVQDLLNAQPQSDEHTRLEFEFAYRHELYLRAADKVRFDVRPETWQAFELTTVNGHSIDLVAKQMNKSVGTIYAARSRVMRRLREAVREIEGDEE